jgi:hypothetical protein
MFKWVLSGKAARTDTELEKHLDAKHGINSIPDEGLRDACSTMWEYMKKMLTSEPEIEGVSLPPPDISPEESKRKLFERIRRFHNVKRK